jgi:zinc protease
VNLRIIQNSGGEIMYTQQKTIQFITRFFLPAEFLYRPEADRMVDLMLTQEKVEAERNVVMEERRLEHEDDPQTALFEEVRAISFKVHPYQRPVIGWMSDLQAIGRDDLVTYYRTYYSPDNAFIVVAGDVKSDELFERIKRSFESIPAGHQKKSESITEPVQRGERRVELKREAESPYIIIAYHTPGFPDEDSFALDVLQFIFSGGKSSRLYHSLVYEKKIVLDTDAEYIGLNRDSYLFLIDAKAVPGKEIKYIEKSIYSEIEKIKREPPSEYEIRKAKNQIEFSFISEQDSVETLAERYGIFEMLGDWRSIDRYLDGIRNVKPEDIVKVARRYFTEDNRIVGVLIPERNEQR